MRGERVGVTVYQGLSVGREGRCNSVSRGLVMGERVGVTVYQGFNVWKNGL